MTMRTGLIVAVLVLSGATMPSSPDLGKKEGQCRVDERGPSLRVSVTGLKDRQGNLKLEVYPADNEDFLADDNVLLSAGKVFRRIEMPVPSSGPVELCIRVPKAGIYAASLLHDRDGDRKFGWRVDGIGFSSNPKLGWSKPKAAKVAFTAGSGPTRLSIVMNYRSGLGVAPLQ
ncbi:DUF2141 domain-containing protein [Novosphingobium sp. P6W]|uniref:DUF2141 domain-containing protein n=1 Tax=Novosphingobium sp. P6W TaxID=1609758 RepID=UPI0005C2FAE7|nr:DUF2141 domain-containing protein [Novosphingobium sp. P6W]AXB76557.1 DUF2141 domain-containing protein [Novosphingobium sp. P6W]KIS30803.1 hypothetical protein TQ38_20590 [Novosphingobium sp. P6W]